jgi:outer membrane protein insertion porin family
VLDENKEGDWIDLTFVIHEGPRYQVRNVSVIGNTKFEQAPLSENLELKGGLAFEQLKMQKDSQWLQELYGSQGYVFADVKPETVFLEEPGQVDLVYHIDEGERWRVGRIFVHIGGDNPHTRIQTMLNRVTLRPGQIMDIRELKASERRLLASSLFHTDAASGQRPKITYRIPEDADLEFAEKPRSYRGQSPEAVGPPVLPPPGFRRLSAGAAPSMPPVPLPAPVPNGTDVHVHCINEAHYQHWMAEELRATQPMASPLPLESPATDVQLPLESPATDVQPVEPAADVDVTYRGQSPEPVANMDEFWGPDRSATRHVAQRPPGAYENIRGQSPNSAYVNQAYATVPTGQPAAPAYGGQVVRATGPESAATSTQVQPAQYSPYTGYSQNLQPPAGSVYPTPISPHGPMPGYSVDPSSPLYAAPGVPTYPEGTVDIFIEGNETQTGRLMVGFGVNSDAGVVGNVVVDERNFDWTRYPTSWEDVRNGSAFRGAGQRFRIDAAPGSEVNRYLVSFQEPYLFDRPISLGLSGSYFDRRFRDWDEQRIGGRISLGRQIVERDLSATISYRGENVNIHDPSVPQGTVPELDEVIGDNVLHGFRVGVINDTRDSAFLATQGHYFEVGAEQVIGTFDYPRIDLDFRQYWMLYERPDHSGRHVLSYSTTVGFSGSHTPIYEHYFAGGFATMRGFDFRGASPVRNGVELGGEFQWLNSLQYLFPITADDMLHGVAFVDFGTVEENVTVNDFRVAPGFGARITVPAMGPAPIALDFAFPVSSADFDDEEVFSFSLGFSR